MNAAETAKINFVQNCVANLPETFRRLPAAWIRPGRMKKDFEFDRTRLGISHTYMLLDNRLINNYEFRCVFVNKRPPNFYRNEKLEMFSAYRL